MKIKASLAIACGLAVAGGAASATDLVIAMAQDRAQRLAPTCGGTVNWKCLGDAIGQSWTAVGGEAIWGTVKAGIPPLSTALGVLLLGHAASGYFNTASFATNDFNDAFLVYKENFDSDFDNVIVTMQKLPDKPGRKLISSPPQYASCDAEPNPSLSILRG